EVIVADVNMGQSRGEGALAVIQALETCADNPPPCLIAMTQQVDESDSRRQEIERIADDQQTRTPVFVISKYKTLDDVRTRDLQLDILDWRDFVLRAIVSRRDHARLKRLNRDADLRRSVENLGPFRESFRRAA